MTEILMTRSAVARELKASEAAIRNWALSGRLPSLLTTTNRRVFRKSDVEALKAELTKNRPNTTGEMMPKKVQELQSYKTTEALDVLGSTPRRQERTLTVNSVSQTPSENESAAIESDLSLPPFAPDPYAAAVCAELEADHLRETRRLDDIAYTLLLSTDGDQVEAEKSLEDFIELLFEGGALSMWRYRIVLAKIREGL
jgi:hypothetical protein